MKYLSFLLTLAFVGLISSCSNDSKEEYHTTYFYPLNNGGTVVYADQTTDTISVVSTDNWTINNNSEWMTVKVGSETNTISVTVKEGYIVNTPVALAFQPNTTGELRQVGLYVTSSFSDVGTIGRAVTQYPFIHVDNPIITTDKSETLKIAGKQDENATKPSITFTIYDKNATLRNEASWLSLAKEKDFEAGKSTTVELTAEVNKTGEARSTTLYLTSNGVTTPIKVEQETVSAN